MRCVSSQNVEVRIVRFQRKVDMRTWLKRSLTVLSLITLLAAVVTSRHFTVVHAGAPPSFGLTPLLLDDG